MAPAFWLCGSQGTGLRKGTMASVHFSVWKKALSPSAPTLMPDTSVPPCMPLVPLRLVPQCWSSEGMCMSKSLCGFFKGSCLGLQKFLTPIQSPLVFAARSYGSLPFWHWNPGLGGLVWGWDFSLPRYSSQIFIYHMWMWDQPVSHLQPSYLSG